MPWQPSGWTIYDHPSDYPDTFIARRWIALAGKVVQTSETLTADTVDELREKLPQGLVRFTRAPQDDPVIVEVWL